jgi:hypothetical protein
MSDQRDLTQRRKDAKTLSRNEKNIATCAFATLRFLSNSLFRQGGYEAEINRCVIRTLANGNVMTKEI